METNPNTQTSKATVRAAPLLPHPGRHFSVSVCALSSELETNSDGMKTNLSRRTNGVLWRQQDGSLHCVQTVCFERPPCCSCLSHAEEARVGVDRLLADSQVFGCSAVAKVIVKMDLRCNWVTNPTFNNDKVKQTLRN